MSGRVCSFSHRRLLVECTYFVTNSFPRKAERVIFMLELEQGDWFRSRVKSPKCPFCSETMKCTARSDRKGQFDWFACDKHERILQFEAMPHSGRLCLFLRIPSELDEGPYELEY